MPLLNESIQEQVKQAFANLSGEVKLVAFTQEFECASCAENRRLLEEVAALSDHLSLSIYNFQLDQDQVESYQIEQIPALAIVGHKDYGIRYYGVPAGYEFTSLIEDILDVSAGRTQLSPGLEDQLSQILRPVRLQVFVTPTCPYCPTAVRSAHKLAMASDWITAEMIELTEFPHLAQRYQVMGVPKTLINEQVEVMGAVPEETLIAAVLEAVNEAPVAP